MKPFHLNIDGRALVVERWWLWLVHIDQSAWVIERELIVFIRGVFDLALIIVYRDGRCLNASISHHTVIAWAARLDALREVVDGEHASTRLVRHVHSLGAGAHVRSCRLATCHVEEILIIMPLRHRHLHIALTAYHGSVKGIPELHSSTH